MQRGSLFAGRDEIVEEARQLIIDPPLILKKVDPARWLPGTQAPSVIDILADLQAKRLALTNQVAEHHALRTKNHADLEEVVENNHTSQAHALDQAYSVRCRREHAGPMNVAHDGSAVDAVYEPLGNVRA